MKRRRYLVEQVVAAVKQHELGTPVADTARKLGIPEQKFVGGKSSIGGLETSESADSSSCARRTPDSKCLVADLSPDKVMLRDVAGKTLITSQTRSVVRHLRRRYSISKRCSCEVTGTHRSMHRYRSVQAPQTALRRRIRGSSHSRIRYGYKRIHVPLKREGIHVKKRVYRLYSEEGLRIRSTRPRRHASTASRQPAAPQAANTESDLKRGLCQRSDGQWAAVFRALTAVDGFTREGLAIEPGQRLGGADILNMPRRIAVNGNQKLHNKGEIFGCPKQSQPYGRSAQADPLKLRQRILLSTGRSVGVCQWRDDAVLSARQADRQRVHRIVQWLVTGRCLRVQWFDD